MILAILLASATATTLKGRRAKSAISHRGAFSLPFTRRKTDVAPQTSVSAKPIPLLQNSNERAKKPPALGGGLGWDWTAKRTSI